MNGKFTHKLVALKPLRYNSQRVEVDGQFYAKKGDARLLKLMGKAADAPRDLVKIPPMPDALKMAGTYQTRHLQASDGGDDRVPLRQEYQTKFGKRPYMGWDADTLRAKLAEDAAE